jgi:hypothetical protein
LLQYFFLNISSHLHFCNQHFFLPTFIKNHTARGASTRQRGTLVAARGAVTPGREQGAAQSTRGAVAGSESKEGERRESTVWLLYGWAVARFKDG